MINRELIRIKVVQLVYAYYRNEGRTLDVAEKELVFSLGKAYDLYHYLLLMLVDLKQLAEKKAEVKELRAARLNLSLSGEGLFDARLAANRLLVLMAENKQLQDFREKNGKDWEDGSVFVKKLYDRVIGSAAFAAYAVKEATTFAEDREVIRRIYKELICHNEELDAVLEERSLYWNDDKDVVDTFVLKTIKRFKADDAPDQPLLPEYDSEEDREFALTLFRSTLKNAEVYRQLIRENAKNWEFNRLAFMDVILMQTALAEIMTFPAIPVNVTFNEYLDLAKAYSTPHSASYINGLLDHIVKLLRAENKLFK